MALEAVQAQAGHASIASTRIYLHLAGWPVPASGRAIDAQMLPGRPTRTDTRPSTVDGTRR
jgi:hypothetical protein